jgi:hypothetical protein
VDEDDEILPNNRIYDSPKVLYIEHIYTLDGYTSETLENTLKDAKTGDYIYDNSKQKIGMATLNVWAVMKILKAIIAPLNIIGVITQAVSMGTRVIVGGYGIKGGSELQPIIKEPYVDPTGKTNITGYIPGVIDMYDKISTAEEKIVATIEAIKKGEDNLTLNQTQILNYYDNFKLKIQSFDNRILNLNQYYYPNIAKINLETRNMLTEVYVYYMTKFYESIKERGDTGYTATLLNLLLEFIEEFKMASKEFTNSIKHVRFVRGMLDELSSNYCAIEINEDGLEKIDRNLTRTTNIIAGCKSRLQQVKGTEMTDVSNSSLNVKREREEEKNEEQKAKRARVTEITKKLKLISSKCIVCTSTKVDHKKKLFCGQNCYDIFCQ